ncbi:hypothetical protein BGZ58_005009, partial [Dissophora ornata]
CRDGADKLRDWRLRNEATAKAQRQAEKAPEEAIRQDRLAERYLRRRHEEEQPSEQHYLILASIAESIKEHQQRCLSAKPFLHFRMPQEHQQALEQARLSTPTGTQDLYSDGSLVHAGTKDYSMAFGVARQGVPTIQDVNIKLDNNTTVTKFDKTILRRGQASVRGKMRCNNYMT